MRTIILLVIYIFLSFLLVPVIIFCYFLKSSQPIISISKRALRLGQKVLGISLDVCGEDRIKRETRYVFISNHLSLIDGPLLFMLIPQSVRVLLKKEAFRVPIIGQAMRQVGFVPVDRKALKGGKESIDRAARLMKEKGSSFLIFPEGTRSRDGKPQAFKRGGFFLALSSQTEIAPVTIDGSYELMPKGSFFAKKGKITVIFHEPVSVEGFERSNISALRDRVRTIILAGLRETAAESCTEGGEMDYQRIIEEWRQIADDFFAAKAQLFEKVAGLLRESLAAGHKILIFGNGGSASQAQHFAAELVNKFLKERRALRALALTTDTSALTSIANDTTFDYVFSRQVEALGDKGDVAIGLSTSGNSANIVEAIKAAKKRGLLTVTLTGKGGGKVSQFADYLLDVPSKSTPRIQEVHLLLLHLLAQEIEKAL